MAKGKSTWKYNKLLTARRNYFDTGGQQQQQTSGNFFQQGFGTIGGMFKNPMSTLSSASPTGLGAASMMSAGIGALGGVAGKLLSNGLSSGAGNIVSGVGDALGSVPILGGLAKGALNIVGGGINALFGMKTNQAEVNRVNTATANMADAANAASAAQSFDDNALAGPSAVNFNVNAYKGGLFKKGAARRKNAALAAELRAANNFAGRTAINSIENLQDEQLDNALGNFAAFGGPLLYSKGGSIHIKPENRGKFTETKRRTGKTTEELTHSSNPLTRKRAIFAQNAKKWHHAFGGELNTQGGDFTNGLLYINSGGSHETNPYEGVQLGVDPEGAPNLVEEGETVFNDYVFSKRLKVPKAIREKYKLRGTKDMTFAEMSKHLAKESEERPNDPISIRGLEALMADLAIAQESLRTSQQEKYALGGKLNKFPNGGRKRNKYKGVSGYNDNWVDANGNYIQDYIKMVNSRDAAGWNRHFNDQYAYWSNPANKGSKRWEAINNFYSANPEFKVANIELTPEEVEWAKNGAQTGPIGFMHTWDNTPQAPASVEVPLATSATEDLTPKETEIKRYLEYGTGTPIEGYFSGRNAEGKTWFDLNPGYEFVDSNGTKRDPIDVNGVKTIYNDFFLRKKEENDKKYKVLPTGLRYAPAIGLGIASITDALGLTNKPDYSNADAILEASRSAGTYQPVRFKPIGNYLTYRPFDRDYYINKMNAEAGATRRALLNTAGGNRGTAMAGILAADNNYLNQIGGLARQAEEYNLAQRQQVEDFNRGTNTTNSQGFLQADIANQKALMDSKGLALKGTMTAAEMRERARLASEQAKSANLSGFITSLGDIGRENMAWNWRNFGLETGSFGNVGESRRLLAKGGKIKRKKGLTV